MNRHHRNWSVVSMVISSAILTIAAWNYLEIAGPLTKVTAVDPRNQSVELHGHFSWYVDAHRLVLDIQNVSETATPVDVFRVLLQVSGALKSRPFERVDLAFRGRTKFYLRGEYFHEIGEEYGQQNPVYTMRTFPEHLYVTDGTAAYSSWSGGWLGVVTHQMDDFADFNRKWYIDDLLRAGVNPHDAVNASEPAQASPSVQQVQAETETSSSAAPAVDSQPATKATTAIDKEQAAPVREVSGESISHATADSGPRILTFADQVKAVHDAQKFYIDDVAHTYHTVNCPAARPNEMILAIKQW